MIPGEVRVGAEPVDLCSGRDTRTLVVVNDGDRPIQIGSHLHFPDANPALTFDRESAQGFRLAVPSGTAVRFEPGVSRSVELVALAGRREVPGLQVRPADRSTVQTSRREPRPVVPFGSPGSEVTDPHRAVRAEVRLSDEPPQPTDANDAADADGDAGDDTTGGQA